MSFLPSKTVELVFRTTGERTAEASLSLAIKNIVPNKVHILNELQPFSEKVKTMLSITYSGDYVVFLDADCLIYENMRNFLNTTNAPYTDCYVFDRFRGKIHAGVHITRLDVVQKMQQLQLKEQAEAFVLRPESFTRNEALKLLGFEKQFKEFKILHDFEQFYFHIFAKYVLRELRSRTSFQKAHLESAILQWNTHNLEEFTALQAINFSKKEISQSATVSEKKIFIENLYEIASFEIKKLNIVEKKAFNEKEIFTLPETEIFKKINKNFTQKIFGIGLSRTGTKSLTAALNILGFNVVHYPTDTITLQELQSGNYNLTRLKSADGLTDITAAAFFAQFDKAFPNSKFILTTRSKSQWLNSLKKHWENRPAFIDESKTENYLEMRRFLRAATYGVYEFSEMRMDFVYQQHFKEVTTYFENRKEDLLILNIDNGMNWKELCNFLNKKIPNCNFPCFKYDEEFDKLVETNALENGNG